MPSLLILSWPLFCFLFRFFLPPIFAITASNLLGGPLLSPCPVCNRPSTNPPSGKDSPSLLLPLYTVYNLRHQWGGVDLWDQLAALQVLKHVEANQICIHFNLLNQCNVSPCSIIWSLAHCIQILAKTGDYFTLFQHIFKHILSFTWDFFQPGLIADLLHSSSCYLALFMHINSAVYAH